MRLEALHGLDHASHADPVRNLSFGAPHNDPADENQPLLFQLNAEDEREAAQNNISFNEKSVNVVERDAPLQESDPQPQHDYPSSSGYHAQEKDAEKA